MRLAALDLPAFTRPEISVYTLETKMTDGSTTMGVVSVSAESSEQRLRVSVVMPSFNEAGSIEDAVRDVQQHVFAVVPNAELVVVDSSRDDSPEILNRLAKEDDRVRVIFQPPCGHGPALRAGMDAARGEYLLLIDSDRQIPLDVFPSLWQQAEGRDAVMGMRVQRDDPFLRLCLTKVVRQAIAILFGQRIYDTNVPFKIVRRSVWQQAAPLMTPDTLAPSLFLAIFLHVGRFDVAVRETPHQARRTGTVSIRRWKLFKVCLKAFRQLLQFRTRLKQWQIERHSVPEGSAR